MGVGASGAQLVEGVGWYVAPIQPCLDVTSRTIPFVRNNLYNTGNHARPWLLAGPPVSWLPCTESDLACHAIPFPLLSQNDDRAASLAKQFQRLSEAEVRSLHAIFVSWQLSADGQNSLDEEESELKQRRAAIEDDKTKVEAEEE